MRAQPATVMRGGRYPVSHSRGGPASHGRCRTGSATRDAGGATNPAPSIHTAAQALGLAKRAAAKADEAIRARRNAVRFASKSGASLRDIANATGLGT